MPNQYLFEAPFVLELSTSKCSKGISAEKCVCRSCRAEMISRSNSSYLPLLDAELNFEDLGEGKGWRRVSPSYAVSRLPLFSGRSRNFVENKLRFYGFNPKSRRNAGSVTWIHPDGSQVRIDPAHRPMNPKPNPNPNILGNIMSHVRAHYHKMWSDGHNLLTLDDRGYVVTSTSANAHIPAKQSKRQREFEFLSEVPFLYNTFYYNNVGKEREYENQWLFESHHTNQKYNNHSETDAMFGWAKHKWEQWRKGRANPSVSPLPSAVLDVSILIRQLDHDPNPNRFLTREERDALTQVVTRLINRSILQKRQEILSPNSSLDRKQDLSNNLIRLVNLGRFRFLKQLPQLRNSLIQALNGTGVKFPY